MLDAVLSLGYAHDSLCGTLLQQTALPVITAHWKYTAVAWKWSTSVQMVHEPGIVS